MLRIGGALEGASEHPIARAIAQAAHERFAALPAVADFANLEGLGVQGIVDDGGSSHAVLVGRPRLLAEWSMYLSADLARAVADAQDQGRTAVAVGWDGTARGVLVVADAIKATWLKRSRNCGGFGLEPVLLTGDSTAVAVSVARAVGIEPGPDTVIAEVMPADKVAVIRSLQAQGTRSRWSATA